MKHRLRELEELILHCRQGAAKEFLEEAVSCYEVGAIRSAIVSTWTAVFFDILEKSRELGLSGDVEAKKTFESFEKAEQDGDISKLLAIEGGILDVARDKLELFSKNEAKDLNRIQEDRHRCAHPTLNGNGERFVPSAELARAHIVNAATILIQQSPTQGKAALETVMATVSSKLFPNDHDKAVVALRSTGLGHPRPSLLRNATLLLSKKALRLDGKPYCYNSSRALLALLELHRSDVLPILEQETSKLIRKVKDEDLGFVLSFLWNLGELSESLDEDQVDRIKTFVSTMSGDELAYLDEALSIPFLTADAEKRVSRLTLIELQERVPFFTMPTQVRERLIELLGKSKSFDTSNAICIEIRSNLSDFDDEQKAEILKLGDENDQVEYAFEYKNLCGAVEGKMPEVIE